MSRVRLVGAQGELPEVLRVLLDFGRLQLDDPAVTAGVRRATPSAQQRRERSHLRRILDDVDVASRILGVGGTTASARPWSPEEAADWAREAHRVRLVAEQLEERRNALEDERALLGKHRGFLDLFGGLLAELSASGHLSVYGITLPASEEARLTRATDNIRQALGAEVSVIARRLPTGDLAVLLAVPLTERAAMERALAAAGVPEVPLPAAYAGQALGEAAPHMVSRMARIPAELAETERALHALAAEVSETLRVIRASAHDRATALDALARSGVTEHAFTLEGWVPAEDVRDLRDRVRAEFGERVVIEELSREHWRSRTVPVVLRNPPIFRPFEMFTRMMPLPKYGSIDPTPVLAVTFPMLFGMMMGDVGYGAVLAGLAFAVRWRAAPGGRARAIADVALPCAAFAVIFGVLYGELFGGLGTQWFGMRPVLMNRESAIIAAAVVAVGVGLAHVALGLVLGIVSASRGERRLAVSRSVQLLMLGLTVAAVLAAVEVLPARLFSAFGLAVLVGFPILLAIEGIIAPIEFLSTLGNVLSYVRIMALGTASVMLATVANQMVGIFGSVVVGVLFALLFHLVNFALGLVSPTIHALRLHYVEFFRQFYSGGGERYEPFAHWRPRSGTS